MNITNPTITGLTNTFYSDTVGWIIGILAIAAFAGFGLLARQRRVREDCPCRPYRRW